MGSIKVICVSSEKGTVKRPVEEALFIEDHGIEGDAHAGKWHRQVSLLAAEAVEEFQRRLAAGEDAGSDDLAETCGPEEGEAEPCEEGKGTCGPEDGEAEPCEEGKRTCRSENAGSCENRILPGDFGENILTEGIDLKDIPCGTVIRAGEVVLRITQRGKECHTGCRIRELTGECIMPKEGVFAEVVHGGRIKAGETAELEYPDVNRPYSAAVITLSDKASRNEREDKSGPLLAQLLRGIGIEVIEELVLPDDTGELKNNLIRLSDRRDADLIITTGGTGFSERDTTPEATYAVATRNAPGIAEAIRAGSLKITPRAMLSRGASVIRNKTLIINFPGSPKAVGESFDVIREILPHALGILTGRDSECGRK